MPHMGMKMTRRAGTSGPPSANLAFRWSADPAWCRASAGGAACGIGDAIGAWYDGVGNVEYAEQTTGASKPILRSLGGKYWVQGDGLATIMALPVALDLDPFDSGVSIYYRQIFSGLAGDGPGFITGRHATFAGNWFWGKGGIDATMNVGLPGLSGYIVADRAGATVSLGTADTFSEIWTPGANVTLYKNGSSVNVTAGVGSTLGTGRYCLLGHNGTNAGGGTQFWNGYLRHFLIYNTTHDATQRAAVEAFLGA